MNEYTVQAAQALAVDQQREFAVNFIDRKSGDMRLSIRVRQTPLQLTSNTGVGQRNQAKLQGICLGQRQECSPRRACFEDFSAMQWLRLCHDCS